ncbi:DUF488 family protein [Flavisolibacter tropicus]|uniref:DUF488 domain-containing protein n=1 Tax=Flavisolibacter tropicus TaxID=1492898 RepID=A0A172TUH3_9BACT|nr:DUF488 domain-containing protein [Flavisolibacter tropicus]ANE50636.1 hypothetical protein SY85_09105 [Flavisolibacter tropicus]
MNKPIIYTVGHSTHQLDYFVSLIQEYGVTCLIDVRSVAASSYNPQYNQEPLKNYLKNHGVTYLHFSEEFGARFTDPDLLDDDGQVDFEKVRKSWSFKNGVERLWQGVEKGFVIAMMCSESEPLDCHRFSMVSLALVRDGFDVKHILKDKSLKSHTDLESILLKKYDKKLPKPDIFNPNVSVADQLKEAYRLKNKEIGFSPYSKQPQQENHD